MKVQIQQNLFVMKDTMVEFKVGENSLTCFTRKTETKGESENEVTSCDKNHKIASISIMV